MMIAIPISLVIFVSLFFGPLQWLFNYVGSFLKKKTDEKLDEIHDGQNDATTDAAKNTVGGNNDLVEEAKENILAKIHRILRAHFNGNAMLSKIKIVITSMQVS